MPRTARLARLAAPLAALLGVLGSLPLAAQAADAGAIVALGSQTEDDFLPVEQAFQVSAQATAPDRVEVNFQVNKCCYLYRERMKFVVDAGQPAALGSPDMPEGEPKVDDQGEHHVFHQDVTVRVPVSRGSKAAFTLPIKVSYQGCADAGLCYPPITKTFNVAMPETTALSAVAAATNPDAEGYVSKQDWLAAKIRDGNIFLMIGAFFVAGLALSFTPCVL